MTTPSITLIAALDSNRGIGKGNTLPWAIPDDLKRFKALTNSKPVIMGRKTAESLGRALPWRRNVVLSRQGTVPFAGMHAATSLEQALDVAGSADEIMVIGGGEIYTMFLPLASRMRLTWVDTVVEGADAFFPDFADEDWLEVGREFHPTSAQQPLAFCFVDYIRQDR